METARVELRKLQLLNDRINQCLEALNQVRLTVHGLSHTTAANPGIGGQAASIPGVASFVGPTAGFYGGLSHTPYQSIPQLGSFGPQFAGFGPQLGGFNPGVASSAGAQIPGWNPVTGLSHTGADLDALYGRPIWADPMLATRVKETFPFINFALPPVIALY